MPVMIAKGNVYNMELSPLKQTVAAFIYALGYATEWLLLEIYDVYRQIHLAGLSYSVLAQAVL